MIVSVFWKEYREHRIVWAFMALVAVLLIILVTQVYPALNVGTRSGDTAMYLLVAAVGSVLTYGVVCGAMLLAGEREGSTLPFLDALTGQRLPIWFAKLLPGVAFCFLMGLFVGSVAAVVSPESGPTSGYDSPPISGWVFIVALPAVALDAFVWGMLASALCSSVLTAAGVAALFWLLGGLLLVPCGAFEVPFLPILGRVAMDVLMLVLSATAFCQTETTDRETPAFVPLRRARVARSPSSWLVLAWLPLRQGWVLALVLTGMALVFGLALPAAGSLFWLSFTLLVGVLCGASAFGGEQSEGSQHFLGNQRFPLGRVWAAKIAAWLVAALAISLVFLLAGFVSNLVFHAAGERADRRRLLFGAFLNEDNWPLFLPLGLVYGFAIGQFYALLWRKSIVAVVLALIVSPGFAFIWLPSLVFGGLHFWQVLLPPLVLLAATRLVVWAWCSTGLALWRPGVTLAGCGVFSLLWIVASLFYRALEVPSVADLVDVKAYGNDIPHGEKNVPGQRINTAGLEFREMMNGDFLRRGAPAELAIGQANPERTTWYAIKLATVIEKGWPENQALDRWMDQAFQRRGPDNKSWMELYQEAADMELGVVEDPLNISGFHGDLASARRAYEASTFLEVRAVQLQARQKPEEALKCLFLILDLSRQMRNHALSRVYLMGQDMEKKALRGLDRWLAIRQSPERLRRVLAKLDAHEQAIPSAELSVVAEYARMHGLLETGQLLQDAPAPDSLASVSTEMELAHVLWFAPWEKARHLRLLNALAEAARRAANCDPCEAAALSDPKDLVVNHPYEDLAMKRGLTLLQGDHSSLSATQWTRLLHDNMLTPAFQVETLSRRVLDALGECRLRAARLKTALLLYQAENDGKPAPDLDTLIQKKYLTALPLDPFDGQPLRYRLTDGNDVDWGKAAEQPNGAQQEQPICAVIWSVGPDGADHNGLKQGDWIRSPSASQWRAQGLDVIFTVPAWKKP